MQNKKRPERHKNARRGRKIDSQSKSSSVWRSTIARKKRPKESLTKRHGFYSTKKLRRPEKKKKHGWKSSG
jgi:hypothetical protein